MLIDQLPPSTERLAKAGFALHWLHPKSKRPIGNDWASKPVATLETLKRTYRDGNNVGVRLGKWSQIGGLYLYIVDFDIRVVETADVARNTLRAMLPELDLDTCPTVISGSGGESRHFLLLTDRVFPSKKFAHSDGFAMVWDESKQRDVKKWDWELHLLGTGAQAVTPPSIHPDTLQPYRWIREFDFELLEEMGIGPVIPSVAISEIIEENDNEASPLRQQPLGLSLDEIRGYLNDLPFDDWCQDRDGWYRTGMAVHHETGGSTEGFEVWCEWSKKSDKYELDNARDRWKSFKNRSETPFRMASLVAVAREIRAERQMQSIDDDFDEVEEIEDTKFDIFDDLLGVGNGPERPKKISRAELKLKKAEVEFELGRGAPPKIARMNKAHAVARVSSKTVILDFHKDGAVTYGSVSDLHNYYENDRVPKDDTTEPLSKQWMRSKHRRSYPRGIVFAPNREVEGAYNHWQGFSVEPDDSGSCALFLAHLLDIFCDGNQNHFWYMVGWMAHAIQRPEEKPGVAVVAVGPKGSGKDTIFEYFGGLFANHYITVGNQEQMTGKFNAHQERCLLLHMQEGFWAGDKKAEGQLKYLITSTAVMIEPKGMNAFPIKSVLRLFISSNERWVVPATQDERRFFVVNVSAKRRNDHAYFAALRQEMENGGREALLHYLMTYDISDFQVRAVQETEGLAEQKVEGLKNVERWWFEILQHGGVEDDSGLMTDQWSDSSVRINKNEFRYAYSRWMRTRRYDGEQLSEVAFSKRLKTVLPGLEVTRTTTGGPRLRFFIVPPLFECRRSFESFVGSDLQWSDSEDKIELRSIHDNTTDICYKS